MEEYELLLMVERLGPEVISGERKMYKGVSANVDFYSGFVYHMLDLPQELYTPLFAMARVAGWGGPPDGRAHQHGQMIRPSLPVLWTASAYTPLKERS